MVTIWTKAQKIIFFLYIVLLSGLIIAKNSSYYYIIILSALITTLIYIEYKNIKKIITNENPYYNKFSNFNKKYFLLCLIVYNLASIIPYAFRINKLIYQTYNLHYILKYIFVIIFAIIFIYSGIIMDRYTKKKQDLLLKIKNSQQ